MDYNNVDTTVGVTFAGTWTFTEKGSTSDVLTLAAGNITIGTNELTSLTANKTYTLTWTPAYTGTTDFTVDATT